MARRARRHAGRREGRVAAVWEMARRSRRGACRAQGAQARERADLPPAALRAASPPLSGTSSLSHNRPSSRTRDQRVQELRILGVLLS